MRLSREKLVHLSHVIVAGLDEAPEVEFQRERNDVRLLIFTVLQEGMRLEEEVEQNVRRKILSQKKEIPEGSRDWDILYRKYYEEEMAKHRLVR